MLNIFPLSLLLTAKGSQVLVEVKSGDTYHGQLDLVDKFMNIKLTTVIHSASDGQKFHSIKEILIKGSSIKYFQLQPATEDKALEEAKIQEQKEEQQQKHIQEQKLRKNQNQRGKGNSRSQQHRR